MRDALLRTFSENALQLERIIALQLRVNELFAQQSRESHIGFENIERFMSLTKIAHNEIKSSPRWRLLLKYPKYWYHAETHSKYFAPTELQFQQAIEQMSAESAP